MQGENRRSHCERKIELECRKTKGSLCAINGPSIADNFLCTRKFEFRTAGEASISIAVKGRRLIGLTLECFQTMFWLQ